uniref:multimerin-1 n=1 Tax=Jaculus jaculus TaxID=51337 RepID=UPI001E1B39E6|nr:multimerin-1 [Jaculus jaculus]
MRGVNLFVLLSSFWSVGIGLNSTKHSWTIPKNENSHKNITSASVLPTDPRSLQRLLTTQKTSVSVTPASEEKLSEENLLQSTLSPLETNTPPVAVRSQTLKLEGKTEEGGVQFQTPALPTQSTIKRSSSGAEAVVLSNATLRFLQSFANKSNQQATFQKLAGGTGNRSPRQTYLSRGKTDGSQRFEAARGKNWCAYVHTRLSPTVILDSQVSYVPNGRGSCGWSSGSCPQRSQKISNAIYRMQHKIVTSLEWRCCPGYSGPQCHLNAQEQQQLMHSNQVESHPASDRGTAEESQQQQDCGDPAVTHKLTEQVSQQATRLELLQKQLHNASLAMEGIKTMFSSLEGKISEDKSREFQSALKGLKTKGITEFIQDTVRKQLKVFQNDMQETVAQLFKTVSHLSEELEDTRQVIQQVNQSVASVTVQPKPISVQQIKPTLTDMENLRNHIMNVRQEMTFTCEKPIKELETKQALLESALEQERSRGILYYKSLNQTLSKMKEIHEQLLSAEVSDQKNVTATELLSSNVTKHMSILHEKVNKQGLMLLKMFDDLHIQDNKINNLTISLAMEKESVRAEWEEMLSKCRNDFTFQLKDAQENVHVLNQTLAEVIFPMDDKVDKMNEQLNDLMYDMEILQPLLEQGSSLRQTTTQEQPKEAADTRKKVENLTSAVNSLNFLIKELNKRHNLLRNEVQSRGEAFERRISDCVLGMEDGLNKTMIIINNAIDFVQDNYMLKETLNTEYNPKVHHNCNQNMETILAFIPQFQRLNDSIQTLFNDNQKYNFVLQVAKALADIPKDEKTNQFNFQKIYHMFNETTSQVKNCLQNMSHLEANILSTTKISKNLETQLQGLESKVTKTLIPYYISPRKGSVMTSERDTALQLQVLTSRFKALEAKSIHLSVSFSLLNKTVHKLLTTYQTFTNTSGQNATIPMWIKASLPDIQVFQKSLRAPMESIIKIQTQAALSNLTSYIEQLLSERPENVKSQKQVKLYKKSNTLKKPAVNLTTILIGRSQRNTENILYPVTQEHSGCSMSPCENGGTCITGSSRYTCACRHPFTGDNCTIRLLEEHASGPDFSQGSYRYAPMVAFFASHTYGMTAPGPILFNNLDVNYGASYNPRTGKFRVPYLGVYIFKYTIESFSAHVSGFLVVDGRDKLTFESENINNEIHCDRVLTGDALLELNYGQEVWLRLVKGKIPVKYPPVSTFSGYLLYRT